MPSTPNILLKSFETNKSTPVPVWFASMSFFEFSDVCRLATLSILKEPVVIMSCFAFTKLFTSVRV